MFTSIKTSRENKALVTELTRKMNLGAENVVARLALAYSLSKDERLELSGIQDSQGKEYSRKVLLGEYDEIYIAMLCVHYDLYKTDKDIARYIKLHIDHGLTLLNDEFNQKGTGSGLEFLIQKIEKGLASL